MRFLATIEFFARAGGSSRVLGYLPRLEGVQATAAVEAAIEASEGQALSYLLGRYLEAVPATPGETPSTIKDRVADIALYELVSRHNDRVPDELRTRRDDAVSWFRDVQAGRADLGLATDEPVDRSRSRVLISKPIQPSPFTGWLP